MVEDAGNLSFDSYVNFTIYICFVKTKRIILICGEYSHSQAKAYKALSLYEKLAFLKENKEL